MRDLSLIQVENRLPSSSSLGQVGDAFPEDLIGATVVRIGAPTDYTLIEGGGLVIDYRRMEGGATMRIVLGFTELGAWVEYLGPSGV